MPEIYRNTDLKPGDIVWAFAYHGESRTRGKKLRQTPVQGRVQFTAYPDDDLDPGKPVRHFVPMGKTGAFSWSKVIDARSRLYAKTEQDAIEGYNLEIKKVIDENQTAIRSMLEDLIPTCETETGDNGWLKNDTPFRADLSVSAAEVIQAMTNPMPACFENGEVFEWDEFVDACEHQTITDYDGNSDIVIDGNVTDNNCIWITTGMLYIFDKMLIPFQRIPEIFAGHKIQVLWYNK